MARLPEQKVWDSFKKNTESAAIRLWRVENLHGNGMSDLIGISRAGRPFWIEMKALEQWPKRDSTRPLHGVFEPGQIPFMKEWRSWMGLSYVLLRVGKDEWFLLNPSEHELVEMTRNAIQIFCVAKGLSDIIYHLEGLK